MKIIVNEGSKMAPASAAVSPVGSDDTKNDGWLEEQKHIWKKEQQLIASMVQVYRDPNEYNTIALPQQERDQQGHDDGNPRSMALVVEDTPWYKILQQRPFESDRKQYFGGVDTGFANAPTPNKDCNDDGTEEHPAAVAVYVIIDALTMQTVYRDHVWIQASELPPYVSGYLAFREINPLEQLVHKQVKNDAMVTPSAILVDGNGIFHPRKAGIACFLGVRTGIPTIGIGKTLLYIEKNSTDNNIIINNNNYKSEDDHEKNRVDEFQWTRSKLDKHIDRLLYAVHRRIVSCDRDESATAEQPNKNGLLNPLKESKRLILPKLCPDNDMIDEQDSASSDPISRERLLKDLAPFCNGIAVPLEAPNHDDRGDKNYKGRDDDRFRYLGTALVGNGGAGDVTISKSSSTKRSKRPIIVSVGHKISLAEAALITASLSMFRIPEPVRQADLYGRELLRQRKLL